jgi:hypothetical protein
MEFMYEHTDIPAGLTLPDYRRARPRLARRTFIASLRSSLDPRRYSPVGGAYFERSSTSR